MGLNWREQGRMPVFGIYSIWRVICDEFWNRTRIDVVTRISLSVAIDGSDSTGMDGRGRPFARYPLLFIWGALCFQFAAVVGGDALLCGPWPY